MNIQISVTRMIAAFFIGVLWVMTSFIAVTTASIGGFYGFITLLILTMIFLVGCVLTYGALSMVHHFEADNSQNRVERMLSKLDERDLDVLRNRLVSRQNYYDGGEDGEYDSLEDLLDQQKRKRG